MLTVCELQFHITLNKDTRYKLARGYFAIVILPLLDYVINIESLYKRGRLILSKINEGSIMHNVSTRHRYKPILTAASFASRFFECLAKLRILLWIIRCTHDLIKNPLLLSIEVWHSPKMLLSVLAQITFI